MSIESQQQPVQCARMQCILCNFEFPSFRFFSKNGDECRTGCPVCQMNLIFEQTDRLRAVTRHRDQLVSAINITLTVRLDSDELQ